MGAAARRGGVGRSAFGVMRLLPMMYWRFSGDGGRSRRDVRGSDGDRLMVGWLRGGFASRLRGFTSLLRIPPSANKTHLSTKAM